MEKEYDTIIIGQGVAGLAAAIYCGRLNLKTIVVGAEQGGTLINASIIENYTGFSKISGVGLMEKLTEHAKDYKIEITQEKVEKISKEKNKFRIQTNKKDIYSKTIIFCTGSTWRKLNIPGEEEFANKGVHYCALCDGFFYKDKTIAVLGGGDSAVKEALLLSNYAKKIYLISRSPLRPEPINFEKLKKEKKIEFFEGINVKEIIGSKFAESVLLDKKIKGSDILKLDGIFVEIGRLPLSELAISLGVKINKNKEIITDKESKTNVKGIFASGDVTNTKIKQAITGVGDSVKAAYSAYEYLNQEKAPNY